MNALSLACNALVVVLCVLAVLVHAYDDNWGQFIGLVAIAGWAAAHAHWLWLGAQSSGPEAMLDVGLLAYGLGTAWKVWRRYRVEKTQ